MKDRMAHEKTKRRLDVLNGVPGFINKLINHECIDNKRNFKSSTPQDHVNIYKFYETFNWV